MTPRSTRGPRAEAARILVLFVLFGLLKHVVPIGRLVRLAWCSPRRPRNPDGEQRTASLVLRVGVRTGFPDDDCLQRSLLLYHELSKAGAQPELVVGFRKDANRTCGHAWVTVDNRPVAEQAAALLAFVPTLRFGPGGRLLPT